MSELLNTETSTPVIIDTFFDNEAEQFLIISNRQKMNPVVKKINRVRYKFKNIVPDFLIGKNNACIFISMKYHRLKPNYLQARIKTLQNKYTNRILLCLIDIDNIDNVLGEINQYAFFSNCTLILCWSLEECARVLEDFKINEKKFHSIKNKIYSKHDEKISEVLKKIRCMNSNDALTLMKKFGNFKNIVQANKNDLINCPGLGNKKISTLLMTFNDPFF